MFELLIKIGEIISMELNEVNEIEYSDKENNILIIVMKNKKKYKLTLHSL